MTSTHKNTYFDQCVADGVEIPDGAGARSLLTLGIAELAKKMFLKLFDRIQRWWLRAKVLRPAEDSSLLSTRKLELSRVKKQVRDEVLYINIEHIFQC
jgi:hypothetical protein